MMLMQTATLNTLKAGSVIRTLVFVVRMLIR